MFINSISKAIGQLSATRQPARLPLATAVAVATRRSPAMLVWHYGPLLPYCAGAFSSLCLARASLSASGRVLGHVPGLRYLLAHSKISMGQARYCCLPH